MSNKLRLMSGALALPLVMALGACSSMSAKQCGAVDWRAIGYQDGVAGRSGDHFGNYQNACAKHGIRSDFASYQAGREEGLREYCKPDNGYRVGSNGYEYAGVCPANLERDFRAAYEAGHELYMYEWRAQNAANQLASKRHERNHIEQEIISNAAAIVGIDSIPEDRAHAMVRTHQLVERAGQVEVEIAQLERDKLRYDAELENYRARVASNR
jgi:hypothetical protein